MSRYFAGSPWALARDPGECGKIYDKAAGVAGQENEET
jgi:hypothetical protein